MYPTGYPNDSIHVPAFADKASKVGDVVNILIKKNRFRDALTTIENAKLSLSEKIHQNLLNNVFSQWFDKNSDEAYKALLQHSSRSFNRNKFSGLPNKMFTAHPEIFPGYKKINNNPVSLKSLEKEEASDSESFDEIKRLKDENSELAVANQQEKESEFLQRPEPSDSEELNVEKNNTNVIAENLAEKEEQKAALEPLNLESFVELENTGQSEQDRAFSEGGTPVNDPKPAESMESNRVSEKGKSDAESAFEEPMIKGFQLNIIEEYLPLEIK